MNMHEYVDYESEAPELALVLQKLLGSPGKDREEDKCDRVKAEISPTQPGK
jgi:hypothetical protein